MPVENGNRDDEKHRMTPTSIDSLSDDDLITILVKLPAQDLHDFGRLVCRRWYRLICSPEFIQTHRQCSPTGILIQWWSNGKVSPVFVGLSQGRIETYKLRYRFTDRVLSSCNGLILQGDYVRNRLFVANPATKQHFSIPLYPEPILCIWLTCLGYIAATKVYKVVHINNQNECAILTVGVDDSWRFLPTDHLPNSIFLKPVATEGFVHWVTSPTKRLVTLDLETETISDVPFPEVLRWCYCFSAGKCLSFVNLLCPEKYCWEVWEMRPGPVAEWNKLFDVNLEGKKGTHERLEIQVLYPVGWIKYKEVLLFKFCSSSKFVAYNVCTKGIEVFELDFPYAKILYATHTNSLVWLDASTFKTG